MENIEQSLVELIEGGVIIKDGSWYTVKASGEKFHGKSAILEHIGNQKKAEKPEDNTLPIPDEGIDETLPEVEPVPEPEVIVEPEPEHIIVKPKTGPKPKTEMAMVVAVDKQGWGRRNIKHGVIADFGKGDKVVTMPKDAAVRMCSLHKRLFKILDPQTTGLLIDAKPPKKPSEYTNPELMLALVNRYKNNSLFMSELRAMLLEVDGNMYAISRCLSDNEMVECLNTTGQYVVLNKSAFEQANNEMANIQADNADMRSRLNLQPRIEPVNG